MKPFRILILLILIVSQLLVIQYARAEAAPPRPERVGNNLALTPPMGWNTWNKFACNVSEALLRQAADAMVTSGMRDAGYEYIVIDDCWQQGRDKAGNIYADPARFPSGMKALGDYIHSRGLKFGIYSDAGSLTCGKRPGSLGHEYQDAQKYAEWGVDYLKYDWCSTYDQNAKSSYETMSDALRATGRPIVLSICEWGLNKPWQWGTNIGNLWRTTDDIYDHWEGKKTFEHGVMDILDLQVGLESFSGPGHWNDPDMLEVGNGKMSNEEYRSHFSLWAILAAPLMAGNDLSAMTEQTRAILTNREVIAIDQDALGIQAKRVAKHVGDEVWARPLQGGGRAVVLLNRSETAHSVTVSWDMLNLPDQLDMQLRDVWLAKNLPAARSSYTAMVPSHGVVMLRLDYRPMQGAEK
ncbi:glycoside hydrolase family 27 protein [Solimicrobium silvestre]|uniref:Alpha-galactosidase n=1 Tax=Solimicrobium silvestre TaxID=2099400 RepID=A0A2S9H0B4_9BURK|nr:glycoside hydrolase family 27 protein [Solimicrobium silvestre]PRC93398.1 Melibiase [Solimicrobium silvestre]